jgi:CRISPR-associated protein Cmr2
VRDLPKALWLLREVYSGGTDGKQAANLFEHDFDLRRGFVQWRNRLYQVMGEKATASAGAVIAHHQAPLGAVLRDLREAEKRAKTYRRNGDDGKPTDRDAFSLTVVKRSGGALILTDKWGEPMALLVELRDFLAKSGVSRRAVYHTLEWLNEKDLPEPEGDGGMLQSLLAYQFDRQTDKTAREAKAMVPSLAERLTAQTLAQRRERIRWLRNFLTVAEFLARETRAGEPA